MICNTCGKEFDEGDLDQVVFHETHRERPDIQYRGSREMNLKKFLVVVSSNKGEFEKKIGRHIECGYNIFQIRSGVTDGIPWFHGYMLNR